MRRLIALLSLGLLVSLWGEESVIDLESKAWRVYSVGEGNEPPDGWEKLNFDDRSWKGSIEAEASGALYRMRFNVEDIDSVRFAQVSMRYCEGAVVYLNGVEWFRANMPPGFIDQRTAALAARDPEEAKSLESWQWRAELLEEGGNVLAVSLHGSGGEGKSALDLAVSLNVLRESPKPRPSEPAQAGRLVSWQGAEGIEIASAADWRVTAFEFEELAVEAYEKKDWKEAAASHTRSLLAYRFAGHGSVLRPELKRYFLEQTTLAREFLELLSPYDREPRIYAVLNELHGLEAARFRAYPRLALAIAIVYDQAPPRYWPHRQVSSAALPRRLPAPDEAFAFWIESEARGKTLFPLNQLMVEELKYVVDVTAPLDELRWAQESLSLELEDLVKVYGTIKYDMERYLDGRTGSWGDGDYQLSTIRERGGICSDQAYYMTQAIKAHGVPCITVVGTVANGLHAWVGFMESPGRWNFRAGRSPESAYVTGRTFDPQTWQRPMEYELAFLKEPLASEPRFRLSGLHSSFALMALREGDEALAVERASEALTQDARNRQAWELLIDQTKDPREQEALARNAAKAFRNYPDLEAGYLRRLASKLTERGEIKAADRVRAEILKRNQKERPDVAMTEAARELRRVMREESIDRQVNVYKRELSRFQDAGLIAVRNLVRPFVGHLIRSGEEDLARKALTYARLRLVVSLPAALEREFDSLEARIPKS